ncbi:MAG TPA: hypothetical protein VLA42_18185 [Verrucomicrobiae bacterium]|nr:hypothetical protein [Verrucomicrobiae bacterium]
MSKKKKKTAGEIADELTTIAVEHLDKLSPEEREKRIQALEKRVATFSSSSKKRAVVSTPSSSSYTPDCPVYARDRERN